LSGQAHGAAHVLLYGLWDPLADPSSPSWTRPTLLSCS